MPVYAAKIKKLDEVAKIVTIHAPDMGDAEKEANDLAGKKGQVVSIERKFGDD